MILENSKTVTKLSFCNVALSSFKVDRPQAECIQSIEKHAYSIYSKIPFSTSPPTVANNTKRIGESCRTRWIRRWHVRNGYIRN